ncbi:MAG: kelch repeat-containing protein [Meiothermus sp.]|nr:kelch repeat-containing protein [Meiothermus sp.]
MKVVARVLTLGLAGLGLAAAPGQVTSAPQMNLSRAGHSATLLPSGQVLVAGGCIATGCENGLTASAELYDLERNTFTRTSSMKVARVGHRAVLLHSGKVLILGGWAGNNASNQAELFHPADRSFSSAGTMLEPRDGFSATLLKDGRVLVVGGYNGRMQRLKSAEIYDPKTAEFRPAGSLAVERMAHSATLLDDGRVLVAGGSQNRDTVLSSAELYDPQSGSFSPAPPMLTARHKHAALALPNGKVLVTGGAGVGESSQQYDSTELFDPRVDRFTPGPTMEASRFKIPDALALLKTGEVLVGGSATQVELYNPTTNSFRVARGSLSEELSFTTATLLPSGSVLIAGGYNSRIEVTNKTWFYRE